MLTANSPFLILLVKFTQNHYKGHLMLLVQLSSDYLNLRQNNEPKGE